MRISIVTISFNQVEFLGDCMDSVLAQDLSDVEYIVVDAGSTDGSRELLRNRRSQLSHLITEPDKGPADGLNKGFALAEGEVLFYLNSDDLLLPGALKEVVRAYSDNPGVDVVHGDGLLIDRNGTPIRRIYSTPFSLRSYLYGGCSVVQQATFFRRSSFNNIAGFNVENQTCWDGELLVDLALSGAAFLGVPVPLGGFRIHTGSISGSGRLNNEYARDKRRMVEQVLGPKSRFEMLVMRSLYRLRKYLARPEILLKHSFLRDDVPGSW